MQAIARSAGQTAFELRSPPSLPTRSIAFSRLSLTAAIEQVSRALLAARWHEMDGEEASTIFGQGGRGARECP
jgi:hypothetical protein